MVTALKGVTHNYRRENVYNLWFTLTAGSQGRLDEIIDDLKATTGIVAETANLNAVRTLLSLAAAEAGVAAFDSAYPDIADSAGFEADARAARGLGFRGKSCIHPSQVDPCNRIYAPNEAEIEDARALLAVYEAAKARGAGAVKFRGRLVDSAHANDARELLSVVL